jgi:hypothetical protein
MAEQPRYRLTGHLLGACSCDWGCPCNFEARPTQGWCQGSYVWHVEHGHYQDTSLDGSTFAMFIKFPGAPHEGNGTGLVLIDDKVSADQRTAIETLIQQIPPFSIFHSLLSDFLGFRTLPFTLHLDGIHSRLTIPNTVEWQLTPMTNPVTGAEEYATLLKPTGFTSQEQALCTTTTFRMTAADFTFDHSGKYGEFSPFEYTPA